jgi:acetyltransferase
VPQPGTAAALGTLWTAVTRAGGAVGFPADAPEEEIRLQAEHAVAEVGAGRAEMIVIEAGDALAGTVFLRPGAGPLAAHRAEVVRLMVDPRLQGRGWGRTLLAAAVARGRALGLEQLLLSTRGGTSLPDFYRGQGWAAVGVWPGALWIGPGDVRDLHWFQLRLG